MGHLTVQKTAGPEDAPGEAKTVTVGYTFDRDIVNKDFDKTFNDGFEKKGLKVDEQLTAHAHFDVKDAKITGTVTYVKKGMGHYSILEADLVATGHYDADVQVEGQMHATTGVGISGDVRLAAKYKKAGFDGPDGKKPKFQFESKAPNFDLAPRPYLKVEGKQQHLKGRCSLQPTAVLLLEHSVGAKLSVEPYVALEATRASSRDKWTLDAQAGVSVSAATDIEIFGRQVRKAKEYALFDVSLTKPGDEMGSPPRIVGPAVPPKTGRAAKVEVASVLNAGLGGVSEPAAVAEKASMPRAMRGVFGRKKRL